MRNPQWDGEITDAFRDGLRTGRDEVFDRLEVWSRAELEQAQRDAFDAAMADSRSNHARGKLDILWKLRHELLGYDIPPWTSKEYNYPPEQR